MLIRKLPPWLALAALFAFAAAAPAARAEGGESLPELIRRVKPSVVSVITYNAKGEVALTGSGFFVRPGQVLTNLHVVEGAHHAEVRTFEGKGKTYPVAGLTSVDEDGDLAVLNVDMPAERANVVETTSAVPEEGEHVFVIGNPLRLEGSVADGIVSAVREVPGLGRIVQITAPISHGNSGSPVFNMKGQVLGVVTIRVMNGQNINLALGAPRFSSMKPAGRLLSFEDLARMTGDEQKPDSIADWWYRNGLNSLWLGNYDGALDSFENAVSKDPSRVEAWVQVGYCLVKQGKNAAAIRAYKQALRLNPAAAETYNKLGDAYYYAGSFDEALSAYRQAARLRPDQPEAYYNLGMTYLELGDRDAARAQGRVLERLDAELYKKLMGELKR